MDESQEKQAWIVALRLLAATPKSRGKLFEKLRDKGFAEEVVNKTLDGLEAKGLLSDKAFAQDLVSKYLHSQPSGTRRIRFELKRRGVSKAVCEEVLSGLDPENERERAKEISLQKWARFKNLEPQKRKKKIYDFLLRRGFDFDLIREVVEEIS